MSASKDSICARISRLNQQLLSPYCQGGTAVNTKLHVEGLQDALLALYEECNCERLQKLPEVSSFLEKFASTVLELYKVRVKVEDFNVKAVIGQGNFGKVCLVQERSTNYFYAMKILPKEVSQAQREASSYEEERDILALAAHSAAPEWLTALHCAFQDASNLYLVMEYMPGGDLDGLLDRFGGSLPEDYARFYLAEIVQALNSLHQLGYVHRDVKPDNVLLDRCGHVKLADFGSAAKLRPNGKVKSPLPVGTPEYIAPEVLQSVSGENGVYGVECDYWSLGVLAYELVFGTTPFQGVDRTHVYSNIMSHEGGDHLEFPSTSGVSREIKSLISGLLDESAETRFTYANVKKHSFFAVISWETLRDSVPPFVPLIHDEGDISNFIDHVTSSIHKVETLQFKNAVEFSGKQLPFVGFTLTPGVVVMKAMHEKETNHKMQILQEVPNKPTDHPDIIRSREISVLRDMLRDREKRLETSLYERRQIETQLDQMTVKASSYKKTIEQERQDRREVENKAVEAMKVMTSRWQKENQKYQTNYMSQLNELEKRLARKEAQTHDLRNQLLTCQKQLKAERENCDKLQDLLRKHNENIAKTRRETLTCIGNAQQVSELKLKLNIQEAANQNFEEKTNNLEAQVTKLQSEASILTKQLEQSLKALGEAETIKIASEERLKHLEAHLQKEQVAHNVTKNQLAAIKSKDQLKDAKEKELKEAGYASFREQLAQSEAQRSALEGKLEVARCKNDEQQSKVEDLERLLGKVEDRLARLEVENNKLEAEVKISTLPRTAIAEDPEELSLIQAQLERVETQLAKSREASVLDRQAARSMQTELYKKEKELSDAKIDLRIVNREHKLVEKEAETLRAEKQALAQSMAGFEIKITELEIQLDGVRKELECTKLSLDVAVAQSLASRKHEEVLQNNLKEQSQQLRAAEARASEQVELATKLQCELVPLRQEVAALQKNAQENSCRLQQVIYQLESLEMEKAALKKACTILDEQLEDSDKVRMAYDIQISHAKQEMSHLCEQLNKIQCDLRAKTAEADEMRILRKTAEEGLAAARQDAIAQMNEALKDMNDLKQQLYEGRQLSDQLLLQVRELEEALRERDSAARDQQHMVEALQAKCKNLQEEIATILTDLQTSRDISETLSTKLEMVRLKEKETAARLSRAEAITAEERVIFEQEVLKLKATLNQQTKLINFLQNKQVEKKKKTLADVLFGSRPKENVAPIPSPLRPIGQINTHHSVQAAREKAWESHHITDSAKQNTRKKMIKIPLTCNMSSVKMPTEIHKPAECEKSEEQAKHNKSEPQSSPYTPVIQDKRVLPEYCRLTINCAVSISDQVTLLGAEEGLYSLHPTTSGYQLVCISGVTKIKHLTIAPHLGIALFISGCPAIVNMCDLLALTAAAEAVQCSKPCVSLHPVEQAPDKCHICAVSVPVPLPEPNEATSTFLCAANHSHVAVMRWNHGSSQFEPVRLLETTLPTACVLFTPHSLILVCSEMYELDLKDFSVDDFLDQSDNSLASVRTALKTLQGPVGLINVTKPGPRAEPEYMLCLPDIAVFLDAFGQRSRPNDLKWSHKPLAFVYNAPVLFVQHNAGVLGFHPCNTEFCSNEDSTTTSSSFCQETAILHLSSAQLLSVGWIGGSVLASTLQETGTAILTITLPEIAADNISLDSDEPEHVSEEFSFTTSLENSLEDDTSNNALKNVQFV